MAVVCALIGVSMGVSGIGGFLVVPALLLVRDASPGEAVLVALLANLGGTMVTGVVAVVRGHVMWRAFAWLSLGGAAAAFLGLRLAQHLSPDVARVVIAVFLFSAGVAVLSRPATPVGKQKFGALATLATGAFAQLSAVLAGIGGPAVTVPALAAQGHHHLQAIGTGLLHGIVISSTAVVITLNAHSQVHLSWELLLFPSIVVAFMFLVNLFRAGFASPVLIRRAVGFLAIVGGLFTLLSW